MSDRENFIFTKLNPESISGIIEKHSKLENVLAKIGRDDRKFKKDEIPITDFART